MFNLIVALMLTAFPTPDQIKADLARENADRERALGMLLAGELTPDSTTAAVLDVIREDIKADFDEDTTSWGKVRIPMGDIVWPGDPRIDMKVSRSHFIKEALCKELEASGWYLKEWRCDLDAWWINDRAFWLYRWWIVPMPKTAVERSVEKLKEKKAQRAHRDMLRRAYDQ